MKLEDALPIAENLKIELSPFCSRIEIAGSIRRKKAEVKDIEIVCVLEEKQILHFWQYIIQHYRRIKGQPGGKYTQIKISKEIVADIFICQLDNWGNIFAIRTGSADYSHMVLANGWVRAGYKSKDGYLYRHAQFTKDQKIILKEEHELFELIGVPYTSPENRNL